MSSVIRLARHGVVEHALEPTRGAALGARGPGAGVLAVDGLGERGAELVGELPLLLEERATLGGVGGRGGERIQAGEHRPVLDDEIPEGRLRRWPRGADVSWGVPRMGDRAGFAAGVVVVVDVGGITSGPKSSSRLLRHLEVAHRQPSRVRVKRPNDQSPPPSVVMSFRS